MGIRVIWDNDDHTIVRQVFEGYWDVSDFRHCAEKTHKLISGTPHVVHIIMDATNTDFTPSNILSVMRDVETLVAPNQGTVVAVNLSPFAYQMAQVARKIAPRATMNTVMAPSLEAARSRLHSVIYESV